jgi:hypothetical protein
VQQEKVVWEINMNGPSLRDPEWRDFSSFFIEKHAKSPFKKKKPLDRNDEKKVGAK